MDKDQVPAYFGGTLVGPTGCPKCSEWVGGSVWIYRVAYFEQKPFFVASCSQKYWSFVVLRMCRMSLLATWNEILFFMALIATMATTNVLV